MGWFFAEDEAAKKGPKSRQLSMDSLFAMGCKACPLNKAKGLKHPKMEATGAEKPLLYFIGEAPGEDEDKAGKQFIGKSGQLLRKYVHKDFIREARWNNSINCHPPKNRDPSPAELACCRPRILKDIEESEPKLIVAFGKYAMQWFIDEEKITAWRGHLIPIKVGKHSCWLLPTFHPSFVGRTQRKNPRTRKPIPSDQERFFSRDLDLVQEIVDDLPTPHIPDEDEIKCDIDIIYGKRGWQDVKKIEKVLKRYGNLPLVAWDYETASDEPANKDRKTKPYGKNARILCVAVGTDEDTTSIAFDHREAKWTDSQRKRVKELWVKFLFSKAQKIAQNLFFELEWTIYLFGLETARAATWHDTMAQAYVLGHQRGTTNLDALTLINFGFRLKSYSDLNMGDLDHEPIEEVLTYNAMDTKWEYAAFVEQHQRIVDEDLEHSYIQQVRRTPVLALKSYFGMLIDFDAITEFDRKYTPRIEKLEDWFERSNSARKFEKRIKRKFKPSSPSDAKLMFVNTLGRKECKIEDKDGKVSYSTEDQYLEKIPLRIAKYMREYRGIRGNKSKYVDPLLPAKYKPTLIAGKKSEAGRCVWPDGLTHATIHHQFLVTRRTSCSFPNEQYWPKRDAQFLELRKLFTAPTREVMKRLKRKYKYPFPSHLNEDDCWFVAIDYGQIQARIAGMVSMDQVYCTYLWDRNDIHMRWTKELARAYPDRIGGKKFLKDDDALKRFRTDVKNQWTFPLIFGATAKSVSGYLNMPEDVLYDLIDMFFEEMPGLKAWQNKMRDFYAANGYVEGPMGWRRYGPLKDGEVINTPIQNGEAEIVLDAMTRLSEAAQELNAWQFQARLEVHDELGFWIPKKTLDRDLEFIADYMLECEHFDWINVPLCIEIGKGPNWYDQEEVSVIYSDDLGKLDRKECGF